MTACACVWGVKGRQGGWGEVVFRVRGHLALWRGAPPPADPLGQARATPTTPSFLIEGRGSRGVGGERKKKGATE